MKAATDKWKLMTGWPGDGGTDGEAAASHAGLHLARTGMDKTTSNEKLPAGPYTKAKHTQKGGGSLNLPYCFSSFPMQQSTQHQKWSYLS